MTRFWEKVEIKEPSDCWEWKAAKRRGKFTYGWFSFNGRPHDAHRVSWMLTNGEIPHGLCVLHRCDNPVCVNPNHLFLGDRKDNIRDMESKGRGIHPRCEDNPRAKLTNEEALEIRRRGLSGEKRCDLAREFRVSAVAVSYLCNGRSWKELS